MCIFMVYYIILKDYSRKDGFYEKKYKADIFTACGCGDGIVVGCFYWVLGKKSR